MTAELQAPSAAKSRGVQHDHGAGIPGHITSYVNGCRCMKCKIGRFNWETARRQAIADGKPFSTSARVSADRINSFLDAGFSFKAIGRPIGMDVGTLTRIVNEPDSVVLRSTEERILSIKFSDIVPGHVCVLGPMRRLRDLALQGWTCREIADASQTSENTVRRIMFKKSPTVNGSVAERLKEAYEVLCRQQPPTAPKNLSWARKSERRGWKRAGTYINIDSPTIGKGDKKL